MSRPARLRLTKALHLLDRGEAVRAEATLRDALATAEIDDDAVTTVVALCCLGELMVDQGRHAEAAETLRSCLAVAVPEGLDEVCAGERARARSLLAGLSRP
jgi:hypothetical protein